MKVADSISDLHNHGYDCFFLGSHGRLWPASGACWDSQYEFYKWSNIMCLYHKDPWRKAVEPLVVRPQDEAAIAMSAVRYFRSKGAMYASKAVRSELATHSHLKTVYFLHDDFTKSEFTSEASFSSRNLSWDNILRVDDMWLRFLPKNKNYLLV